MASKRDIHRAAQLYRNFREREPGKIARVRLNLPGALMVMGYVDEIHYSTTHGSKAERYKHAFAKGSKPLLCAGPGRGQLFLIGGRYRVTARGITDLRRNGRVIDNE